MMASKTTQKILGHYPQENKKTLQNLARLLNHGRLGGTGKLVILPVDQGFEHGPTRSFASNPPAYDPLYHAELAIEAELNAYAAPLGMLEMLPKSFAKSIPLILKANNNDSLQKTADPIPAVTATVEDALRLGCAAVGFTIYPGSSQSKRMYEEARALIAEAKANGLAAILWAYPRGSSLPKEEETSLEVVSYAAHIACELGAHIVKVKPPTGPSGTLTERVRHVVLSSFAGKRIVIFSGGASKTAQEVLEEVRGIQAGGGSGSIVGRNAFQRPKKEALKLLSDIVSIYKNG